MLFGSKPCDIEGMGIVEMDYFPFKGYKAMSWCGRIIHRRETSAVEEKIITHETIHLMQAKMYGSWWKYYMRYLWEWLKGNPVIHPASSAYYTIPYECEAYANEENADYMRDYDGSNLPKYTFKKRKKLYKSVGGNASSWKQYVKSL